ncbi:MAG: hypothetical protein KC502_04120 [Myxococcales bacterium]|nr:hypothetical protein [Myxococcales bacterium]
MKTTRNMDQHLRVAGRGQVVAERWQLSRWVLLILLMAPLGCLPDIASEQEVKAHLDKLADTGQVTDVIADGGQQSDTGADDKDTDTPKEDANKPADAVQCLTKGDCAGKVLGLTPCKVADCVNGSCQLTERPVDSTCKPDDGGGDQCQAFTCNAKAECVGSPAKDGTNCGFFACGKQCISGKCSDTPQSAYDDGDPCTQDYCDNGQAVRHDPITDLTKKCDDGDACTGEGHCDKGKCAATALDCSDGVTCTTDSCIKDKGCAHTANDGVCDDGDPCTEDGCDAKVGCAVMGASSVTLTCNDGNTCTKDDHCDGKGACTGTSTCSCQSEADCKSANLCLGAMKCEKGSCVVDPKSVVSCTTSGSTCSQSVCDPTSGKCVDEPKNEGKTCFDGNACTKGTTCTKGECAAGKDVDCNDNNACTKDSCNASGGCTYGAQEGVKCDDGSACTTSDVCSKGGCVGTPKACDDKIACTVDSCDKSTGDCKFKAADQTCDDGNPCTTGACSPSAGCLQTVANEGGKCKDGDSCTTWKCGLGQCKSTFTCECKADGDCSDGNGCTADKCASGKCQNTAIAASKKVACDTGDKCQVAGSGICDAGACKAGNKPKDCSGIDGACKKGVCDPKTGQCGLTTKPNGTGCDADGNGCTTNDFCKSGTCQKGAPPDCTGKHTMCAKGTCHSDSASSYSCIAVPFTKGTKCNDGKYCTAGDNCDGKGACVMLEPRTCLGTACATSSCDESTDSCKSTNKADGTTCSDGSKCTAGTYCKTGKCIASGTKKCPDATTCAIGACDPTTGNCTTKPAPSSKSCSDGTKCTSGDKCDGTGGCQGSVAITCTPPGPCYTAYCSASEDKCAYKPVTAGAGCDDGNKCTNKDQCDATGICMGSFKPGAGCGCGKDSHCNDGNPCTTDVCNNGKCEAKSNEGNSCSDGDPCTSNTKCDSQGKCAGGSIMSCSNNACEFRNCVNVGGKATCEETPKPKGTPCSAGWCAKTAACNGLGQCKATVLRCDDGKPCTKDKCDSGDKDCEHDSLDCDDDKDCTSDSCDAKVGCVFKPKLGTSCF